MSNPVADASPVQKQAVRRVPLEFDQNGDPQFSSVTSPDSFKVHALGVMPPKHVIPVIFVPGIMGTNLCANGAAQKQGTPAWIPPNGAIAGLGEWWRRKGQTPVERQEQLSSANTEVYSDGKVGLPRTLFTLTESEAKRRGWGEVHFDSYAGVLAELELALNDQKLNPGTGDPRDLPVWTVAKTLKDVKGHDVLKEWGPIKGDVPPLTDSEFNRLADYYFPVWACGYNWLGSNEDSADLLVQRISDAINWYKRGKYWISVDQVIVVTHSMGGLVARRAAQKVADQILGVVHGVQPVGGAPVVYRRFRAGTETGGIFDLMGSILAAIIGWDAADITCVMANSAGPLELLPTKYYPPGWLKFQQERDGKNIPVMPYLPVVTPDDKISDPKDGITDPYRQIYSQRVQDVWWGMVDDTLLDPAGVASKTKSTAMDAYTDTLLKARTFHDNVKLYFHPNTYAYYGSDLKQVAFSEVRWVTRNDVPADATGQLPSLLPETFTKLGQATVAVGSQKVTFSLANRDKPKDNDDPSSGDGTVPSPSGELVTGGPNPGPGNLTVFRMRGFDHQHSYGNLVVQGNVLYCIAKIAQKAPVLS